MTLFYRDTAVITPILRVPTAELCHELSGFF